MPSIGFFIPEAPTVYVKLPVDPAGYGAISCRYDELELRVVFTYFDEVSSDDKVGVLAFSYCISFYVIENSTRPEFGLPSSDVVYLLDPISFRGRMFQGYCFEFSDSSQTYVVYSESCEVELNSTNAERGHSPDRTAL